MRSTVTAVAAIAAAAVLVVVAAETVDLLVGATAPAEVEAQALSPVTAVAGLVRVALLGGLGWAVTARLLRRRDRRRGDRTAQRA